MFLTLISYRNKSRVRNFVLADLDTVVQRRAEQAQHVDLGERCPPPTKGAAAEWTGLKLILLSLIWLSEIALQFKNEMVKNLMDMVPRYSQKGKLFSF